MGYKNYPYTRMFVLFRRVNASTPATTSTPVLSADTCSSAATGVERLMTVCTVAVLPPDAQKACKGKRNNFVVKNHLCFAAGTEMYLQFLHCAAVRCKAVVGEDGEMEMGRDACTVYIRSDASLR